MEDVAPPYTYQGLKDHYGTLPDDYITFTKGDGALWGRYSIKSACPMALEDHHLYAWQIQAHTTYMVDPPLGGGAPMAGVDEETAFMRNRTIGQVSVGHI